MSYSYDRTAKEWSARTARWGEPLYGHTDMNSAYPVDDYPYGRKLRCRIRYWLESDPKKGFRFVSQTEDPKTLRWNNPKKSTYVLLAACMYLDEKKHVQWRGVGEYDKPADVKEFVKNFPNADLKRLKVWAAKKAAYCQAKAEGKIVWKMNGVVQPTTEEEIGEARKEYGEWAEIARML